MLDQGRSCDCEACQGMSHLTRIYHQEPTAKAYKPMSTALRLKNVLNILQVCLRAFSFSRLVSMGLSPFS